MANDRMYIRCKGCGDLHYLAKCYDDGYFTTHEGEELRQGLDDFFDRHKWCYRDKYYGGFELVYESDEDAENEDERIIDDAIQIIRASRLRCAEYGSEADKHLKAISWLEKQKDLDKMIVVSPEVWDNAISDAFENGKKEGEKQKEPLPIPDKFTGLKSLMLQYFDSAVHRNDDAEIESDTDLWGRKILGYVWKYSDEQKEQKPWKVGANAYFTPEQKPDTRDADDLQLLGFIYDLLNEIEWKDNWAMSKDECLRRLNNYHPQKPVSISCGHENDTEWSEEDKEKIVTISEIIEHCTTIPYSGGTLTLNKEYKKELLCFIKSLRPQPQGVYKQVVHSIFKMLKDKDFYGMPLSSCVSLLNDIRVKCKDADECAEILDEPSWKPSEEQMNALEIAIVRCQMMGLESLYEDLKKLM